MPECVGTVSMSDDGSGSGGAPGPTAEESLPSLPTVSASASEHGGEDTQDALDYLGEGMAGDPAPETKVEEEEGEGLDANNGSGDGEENGEAGVEEEQVAGVDDEAAIPEEPADEIQEEPSAGGDKKDDEPPKLSDAPMINEPEPDKMVLYGRLAKIVDRIDKRLLPRSPNARATARKPRGRRPRNITPAAAAALNVIHHESIRPPGKAAVVKESELDYIKEGNASLFPAWASPREITSASKTMYNSLLDMIRSDDAAAGKSKKARDLVEQFVKGEGIEGKMARRVSTASVGTVAPQGPRARPKTRQEELERNWKELSRATVGQFIPPYDAITDFHCGFVENRRFIQNVVSKDPRALTPDAMHILKARIESRKSLKAVEGTVNLNDYPPDWVYRKKTLSRMSERMTNIPGDGEGSGNSLGAQTDRPSSRHHSAFTPDPGLNNPYMPRPPTAGAPSRAGGSAARKLSSPEELEKERRDKEIEEGAARGLLHCMPDIDTTDPYADFDDIVPKECMASEGGEEIWAKGTDTLEMLWTELHYPESVRVEGRLLHTRKRCIENFAKVLEAIGAMRKQREVVMSVLVAIQKRERLLHSIQESLESEGSSLSAVEGSLGELAEVSQDAVAAISEWKNLCPWNRVFVYQGRDYLVKVHDDLTTVRQTVKRKRYELAHSKRYSNNEAANIIFERIAQEAKDRENKHLAAMNSRKMRFKTARLHRQHRLTLEQESGPSSVVLLRGRKKSSVLYDVIHT